MFPACIKLTSGIIYTGNSRCLDSMTVLKTESSALAGINEKLWLEKTCSNLIPDLPLWIIEYAWSKRMMEVLEVLGPPLWLEGDWCLLTLEEPCRIRVVAAEVWRIVQARDIKHFERVTQFLDVTYQLVPRLVAPIKHMKIMFGLQTLVIMWMLWNDQSAAKIIEKIKRLFPNHLSQYYKCSRRHMELMQKNIDDFKSFTLVLARNRSMRETYIQDLIEEQYGECYAQKLEERLSQYLEELDKVLPQATHIEQVLKQSLPQGTGEKILKKLLSRDNASLASVLRRLLNCAVASNLISDNISPSLSSETSEETREARADKPSHGTLHVVSRPSQESAKEDKLSQTSSKQFGSSQGLWQKNKTVPQESSVEKCDDGQMTIFTQMSGEPELCQIGFSPSLLEDEETERWQQKYTDTESETERNQDEPERMEQMCSRHGKKMKSILQECSEELDVETVQPICSPTSPKSTPPLLLHTSQPLHQHFMSANTSVSSHDSSSTNISLSYIQEMPSNQQTDLASSESSEKHLTPLPTPSVLQITSSSPASLLQSSSLLKSVSKQHNAPRINAEMRDATTFAVVLTQHNLKLSLESQSFLMKSRWLQPHVCLYRLSMEECDRVTDSCSDVSEDEQEFDREKYIFFDANTLYSDTYSESDSTDSDDPDYNPKGG